MLGSFVKDISDESVLRQTGIQASWKKIQSGCSNASCYINEFRF